MAWTGVGETGWVAGTLGYLGIVQRWGFHPDVQDDLRWSEGEGLTVIEGPPSPSNPQEDTSLCLSLINILNNTMPCHRREHDISQWLRHLPSGHCLLRCVL